MLNSKNIFILGTDTDVGKTYISAALIKGLELSGQKYTYYKPVQTGGTDIDKKAIEELLEESIAYVPSSYFYKAPLSPDQAAKVGQKPEVDLAQLLKDVNKHSQPLVIEGAGGLWVPLNSTAQTWADYLYSVECEVVLVARSTLGTLNHTISTLQALVSQGVRVKAVVMSGEKNQLNEDSLAGLMKQLSIDVPIYAFPQVEGLEDFHRQSKRLAEFLMNTGKLQSLDLEKTFKDKDTKYCWHPYTQHQIELDPVVIDRANKEFVYTKSGQKLFDATGSWWVNTIGHCHPRINSAISRQQAKLDHVLFANASHEPAVQLAEAINQFVDHGEWKVFFSDNGSTSLEVALKMCYQYWKMQNVSKKTTFVALKGSYHGDTLGSMSIGGATEFHHMFAGLLFKSHFLDPCLKHPTSSGGAQNVEQSLSLAEKYFAENHKSLCALIVEPMIQGAGGMLMHDQDWLFGLCKIARKYNVLIVFDEVFTGMGRTGDPVAAKKLGFKPDVLCLAKGLTGGNLPLALTLATEKLFDSFLSESKERAFLHGHSFTANPISCAAALETLRIYKDEQLLGKALKLESLYKNWSEKSSLNSGYNIRYCGSVLAFEVKDIGTSSNGSYFNHLGREVCKDLLSQGVFMRPLGNVLYLCPPLNTDHSTVLSTLSKIETLVTHNRV